MRLWSIRSVLITLLFFSSVACADIEHWTEKERKLYHSYIALTTIDTIQTMKMIDCQKQAECNLVEINPILGERPTKSKLIATKIIGNVIIYRMLDRDDVDREKALRWLNAVQGLVVTNNGIYWYKEF